LSLVSITTKSEEETLHYATQLARRLAPGAIVLLSGDLGAGKTTFVRGLAAALGIDPDEVTSPTFTLVHEYRGGRLPLVHVDLYRLDRADLDEIGIDQDVAASGITAIEWAERLSRDLPHAIRIAIADRGDERREIRVSD
jgi:tRNA threonylcarbamoyladenosine biosynthesis protein TsaE